MKNPFKFGTIVDEPYFINRKKEIAKAVKDPDARKFRKKYRNN